MKAENTSISVLPSENREELLWESVPLITCRFRLPAVSGEGQGPRRIDRYYRRVEAMLLKRLKLLHPRFCALAEQAAAAALPVPISEVWTDFETAFLDERFLSIRWSVWCDGGGEHHCDLWELPWGAPTPVTILLPKKLHSKARQYPCLLRENGIWQVIGEEERLLWAFPEREEE